MVFLLAGKVTNFRGKLSIHKDLLTAEHGNGCHQKQ